MGSIRLGVNIRPKQVILLYCSILQFQILTQTTYFLFCNSPNLSQFLTLITHFINTYRLIVLYFFLQFLIRSLPHNQMLTGHIDSHESKITQIPEASLGQQPAQTNQGQQSRQTQTQPHHLSNDNRLSRRVKQQTDQQSAVPEKSVDQPAQSHSNQNYPKNLLAERPPNHHLQSHQKIPPLPHDSSQKPKPTTTKTTQNFYVSSSTSKQPQKNKSTKKIFLTKAVSQDSHGLTLNENKNQQISDLTVLILLFKVLERMRQRGDDMTLECLVNEEKMIRIAMAFLEKKIVTHQQVEKYFSLQKQIIGFVQKINKVTMQNFKEEDQNIDVKIFSKAVALLMTPNMNRFVKDLKTLGKIKVLTFNNLACIYKKKKKFGIALRSVSFALQIEQALLNEQTHEQKYDIIPTYLNKAAILSEMNKHQKAIQQIMKSQKFIQKIQKQVIKQITQAQNNQNLQLKKRLQQKRYYGLYMKMIINYNMGAEREHMKMIEPACEYYKQGRQLALMINNEFMAKKFQAILNKLMEARRK